MAQYKVIITEPAVNDLDEIAEYIISQFSAPMTALNLIESIESAVMSLSHMPHRCPLVDDERLKAMSYRKLNVKNYIVFFTIDEDNKTVVIERILFARRDWLHIL